MNKSELIDAIAADAGLSKADAGKALDATLGAVTGALKNGDTVSLVGNHRHSCKAASVDASHFPGKLIPRRTDRGQDQPPFSPVRNA